MDIHLFRIISIFVKSPATPISWKGQLESDNPAVVLVISLSSDSTYLTCSSKVNLKPVLSSTTTLCTPSFTITDIVKPTPFRLIKRTGASITRSCYLAVTYYIVISNSSRVIEASIACWKSGHFLGFWCKCYAYFVMHLQYKSTIPMMLW